MEERSASYGGGRQTNQKRYDLVSEIAEPFPASLLEKSEKGSKVAVTTKKMMVSVTRRICNAISLGVFFLEAPQP